MESIDIPIKVNYPPPKIAPRFLRRGLDGDDEAIRFEEAKRCVRIQQPAQKKTPRQVKKTEKGNA